MPFPIHPHMLRHGCGYALANAGHDTRALQHYPGHKNNQHTVRYTELAPDRFKDFWRSLSRQYPTTFHRLIDHRNHLNFDQLFGLA
jgi:site-specific recombinase XerD